MSVNSCTDIAYRTICGRDRHYIIVAIIAQSIIVWEYVTYGIILEEVLTMFIGITLVFVLYRIKAMASGDAIIMLMISLVLPSAFDVQYLACIVILGSILLTGILVVSYNVVLNIHWKLSGMCHNFETRSFSGNRICNFLYMFVLFFLTHNRRIWERHVITIEDQNGNYYLFKTPFDHQHNNNNWEYEPGQVGTMVMVAAPVVPVLLATLLLVLLVRFWVIIL